MWPTSEVPSQQLVRAAEKLGLRVKQGAKHTIVVQVHTGLRTQIPRHSRVKRETARCVIEYFILAMGISEDAVAQALRVDPPLVTDKQRETWAKAS